MLNLKKKNKENKGFESHDFFKNDHEKIAGLSMV